MMHIQAALTSIWSHKLRSALAVLGVVIGVAAVTTSVSLGQGVKREVASLIQGLGTNVIAVVAGKVDGGGLGGASNPANFISGDILTPLDYSRIISLGEVEVATPVSLVPGTLRFDDKTASLPVFGTYPNALEAFDVLSLGSGRMFASNDEGNVVVLGARPAEELFRQEDPIGRIVVLGGREFSVIGVLNKASSASAFGSEFDTLSFIPFDAATALNRDQVKIFRIIVKVKDAAAVPGAKAEIQRMMLQNHHGEQDFTVLTQDDILGLFNQILNLLTLMISAIAAISLVVGGIGIMNIMLVTVTERTREIGIRKAVGATRRAIAAQFLVESVVVTAAGGAIGLAISLLIGLIVKTKAGFAPEFSLAVIALAVGISAGIGILFGLWPALRAARKDPAEALRYE